MTTSQPGRDWQAIVVAVLAGDPIGILDDELNATIAEHLVAALGLPQFEQERDEARRELRFAIEMRTEAQDDAKRADEARRGVQRIIDDLTAERDAAREEVRVLTEQRDQAREVAEERQRRLKHVSTSHDLLRQLAGERLDRINAIRTAVGGVADDLAAEAEQWDEPFRTGPLRHADRLRAALDSTASPQPDAPEQPLPDWERELLERQAADVNTADWWNANVPVGTPVDRWAGMDGAGKLIGGPHPTRTRSKAWNLGDGTPVVLVEGFSGGMALWSLTPRPEDAPEAVEPVASRDNHARALQTLTDEVNRIADKCDRGPQVMLDGVRQGGARTAEQLRRAVEASAAALAERPSWPDNYQPDSPHVAEVRRLRAGIEDRAGQLDTIAGLCEVVGGLQPVEVAAGIRSHAAALRALLQPASEPTTPGHDTSNETGSASG